MRALVTGASGAIGKRLCAELTERKVEVRGVVRRHSPGPVDEIVVADFSKTVDWDAIVNGVDVVYHLGAHVHIRKGSLLYRRELFDAANVDATLALADACVRGGVRRFMFLSTVGVHGESTHSRPVTETDAIQPFNLYTRSKAEAEKLLAARFGGSPLEITVLRSPLVFGPGMKGSFAELLQVVRRGIPLPLASVHNRRTLVFVDNLVRSMIELSASDSAAGETFLVGDFDAATPELIRMMAEAIGRRARLFPMPPALIRFVAAAFGFSGRVAPLLSSLQVDSSKLRSVIEGYPPITTAEAFARTAQR